MLRDLLMDKIRSFYSRVTEVIQNYGKWVEENEPYLDCDYW
ncbi:hypothetical protein A8990_14259 [Paenibacillus taihuensis]|uniref:Uncharacterized protein n=1 Tax=Paenibacillus taihuensis TaxID=1156355 RepID=A0A3D9R179_9BACL|nr:hypothetical protein A8990_14259 [Paenibacillus taihuensis]